VAETAAGRCLALHGELDSAGAAQLQRAVEGLAPDTRELTLDLTGLTFLDSSGIRAILGCRQIQTASACSLTLLGAHGQVRDVLTRLGLLERLTVIEAEPAITPTGACGQRVRSRG